MQCSQGHGNPEGTRFCRSCGEPLDGPPPPASVQPGAAPPPSPLAASPPSPAPTEPVTSSPPPGPGAERDPAAGPGPNGPGDGPPWAAPAPPPTGTVFERPPTDDRDGHRRDVIVVAGATVVVLAIIGIGAWLLLGRKHNSSRSAAPTTTPHRTAVVHKPPPTSSTSSSTSTSAPSTTVNPNPPLDPKTVVARLEGTLGQAKAGRAELNQFAKRLSTCSVSPNDVHVLNTIIDNRAAVQRESEVVAFKADGGSPLALDLANLMSRSAAADRTYIPWLRSGAYRAGGCRVPAPVKQANAAVGDAKAAFLARFNAEAAKYGQRANWTPTDI